MREKRGVRCNAELCNKMYLFFANYSDAASAPSFAKFARLIGVCVSDIENFRKNKKFDRAYRECLEIRKDYLTDRALSKKFDPTFVKFLIGDEEICEADEPFSVRVEVLE